MISRSSHTHTAHRSMSYTHTHARTPPFSPSPQHVVLVVVGVEDLVLQELGGALKVAHASLHGGRQRLGGEVNLEMAVVQRPAGGGLVSGLGG